MYYICFSDKFVEWCRKGPEAARVDTVDWKICSEYTKPLKSEFVKIPKKHDPLDRTNLGPNNASGSVLQGIK